MDHLFLIRSITSLEHDGKDYSISGVHFFNVHFLIIFLNNYRIQVHIWIFLFNGYNFQAIATQFIIFFVE